MMFPPRAELAIVHSQADAALRRFGRGDQPAFGPEKYVRYLQPTVPKQTGNVVGTFAGRLAFISARSGLMVVGVLVNAGLLPGIPVFDPSPYSLGGVILSLEGVLLTSFVLLKQAHEARLSERRSHLILQANLLVEKEVTKLLQMMHRASVANGIERRAADKEMHKPAHGTAVGKSSEELVRRLSRDTFYAEDGEITINRGDTLRTRAAIEAMAAGFYAAFPGLVLVCDDVRLAGTHAIFVWTLEGRHADTKNAVTIGGWEEWELDEQGKIKTSLGWFSAEDYEAQIAGR